jgi:hypothetical protein
MNAPVTVSANAASRCVKSLFFWIKHDCAQSSRLVHGSVSLSTPREKHADILSSDCEDWCLDNLNEGVLAEWKGLDLRLHFASGSDAILFKRRWL